MPLLGISRDNRKTLRSNNLALLREEVQEGFASLREEQARNNETVAAMARTLVVIQRGMAAMPFSRSRLTQRDMTTLKDRMNEWRGSWA